MGRDFTHRPLTDLLARKVDADGAVSDQLCWHFVLVAGDTTDDDIADAKNIPQCQVWLVDHFVLLLLEPRATSELLHAGDVDTVYFGTVIRKQRRKRPAYDLTSVDDRDAAAEQALAIV